MLVTPIFTANFTKDLFYPKQNDDGKDRYSVVAIWNPDGFGKLDKQRWAELHDELNKICLQKYEMKFADLPNNFKPGIRKNNERRGYVGYPENGFFATLASYQAPKVSDINGNIYSKSLNNTDEIYSGCKMVAVVEPYSFDNKSKGIALGLRSIKKIGDGPRIDNTGIASKMLDDVEIDTQWLESD